MNSTDANWLAIQQKASLHNPWFLPSYIQTAIKAITTEMLSIDKLNKWINQYAITTKKYHTTLGIMMAGNIPLVGFHDFLCGFITGIPMRIKLSSKDNILFTHLLHYCFQLDRSLAQYISIEEQLKNCGAYIATGNTHSSHYFNYYFASYPHIIRKSRTAVAILEGDETKQTLEKLSYDIQMYFGLGCRNVGHLFVHQEYNFIPLIEALNQFNYSYDSMKYKNNYDYQLTLLLLNKIPFLSSKNLLLTKNESLFSPLSCLYYSYYDDVTSLLSTLKTNNDIQLIVSNQPESTPFGMSQSPSLFDYADGIDTIQFITTLP